MLDRKKWGRWVLLIILAIASALFEAAGALLVFALLGAIVDSESALELPLIGDVQTLVPPAYRDQIVVFMIAITAVFFLVRAGVLLIQAYVQNRVVQNAGLRLSHTLFSGYLQLPYILHVQRNSAESIRNIFHTVAEMVTHVLTPGVLLISESFLVVAVLTVLFATHAVATVGAIVIFGVAGFGALRSVRPRLTELGKRSQVVSKQSVQSIQQGLENLREIRIFGAENSFRQEFFRSQWELVRTRYLRQVISEIPRLAVETFAVFFILSILMFAVAGNRSIEGALPIIGLFGYATLRLLPSINRVLASVSSIHYGSAGIEDLYGDLMVVKEFTAGPPQGDEHPDPLTLRRALDLENVSFRYPNTSRPALSGITMSVRRGESIGIVGETGSGKSTLIDVMCGILRPTSGQVRVDGRDINLSPRAWYASIGVVPQTVVLIDDSLRRNVALGIDDKDIDESLLTECLEIAQLTDVVGNLPEGLDTKVGERGIRLSGGQRQRIAIARALYRQPDILFFDEGTSALDSSTEELVIEGLSASSRHRTLVMIAHRITTVGHCDRIVVMDGGRIEGIGSYQSLVRDNSAFRRLVASGRTDSKAV